MSPDNAPNPAREKAHRERVPDYFRQYVETPYPSIEGDNPISIITDPHTSKVLGAFVGFGDRRFFLDRDPEATDESVLDSLEKLSKGSLSFDKNLHVNGASMTRIGVIEKAPLIASNPQSLSISESIETTLNMKALKDSGSLEKMNWRFQLIDFAGTIFPKGPPEDSRVILLPGASDEEYSLWKAFGFSLDDMIMVEGDQTKASQLQQHFYKEKRPPTFITEVFGDARKKFHSAFIKIAERSQISVVSLDTESALSLPLYADLVEMFTHTHFSDNICFSLNVVVRSPLSEFYKEFLEQASLRTGITYPMGDNPRQAAMTFLPQILLYDSKRTDLRLQKTIPGSYLGNSAVTMEHIFAHFSKKNPSKT